MFDQSHAADRIRVAPGQSRYTDCHAGEIDIAYRLPMALSRTGHQAHVTLWFRFEHNAGPYVEGHVLHAALLPPGGIVRMTPADRQTRFLLETDSISALRGQPTASEAVYAARLSKALHELTLADPDMQGIALDETRHVLQVEARESGDRPLSGIVRRLLQVTESCSRLAESISRTPPADGLSAEKRPAWEGIPRIFANPSRLRGLTLFFYRLNQHHTAQLVFTRLERHTAQDDVASADLDRRLQAAGLIDAQGNVAPGVQARWGWQRNFVLPTPHVLLKACPEDFNSAECIVSREIKIDVWQYPGQVA